MARLANASDGAAEEGNGVKECWIDGESSLNTPILQYSVLGFFSNTPLECPP